MLFGTDSRQMMVCKSNVPKGKLVSIEPLREEINWTIPSFPVLTITFVIVELQGGQLGVIESSDKSQLNSFPSIIDCWSPKCEITIGANAYTVLWDWELWLCSAPESTNFLDSLLDLDNEHTNKHKVSSGARAESQCHKLLKDDFLDSLLGLNEDANLNEVSSSGVKSQQDGPFEDNFLDSLLGLNEHMETEKGSISPGFQTHAAVPLEDNFLHDQSVPDEQSSDSADDEELNCSHELPFKVMGVIHNSDRQNFLEKAFESMYEKNNEVLARIRPDPTNEFDGDAIAVELNYGVGWRLVGFLLKDLTKYVHPIIDSQKLLGVQVGRIQFQTNWQTPGFYIKILIKRKGMWPKEVSASKRVK